MVKSKAEEIFDRYTMLSIKLRDMNGIVQNLGETTDADKEYWISSVIKFKQDFSQLVKDTQELII